MNFDENRFPFESLEVLFTKKRRNLNNNNMKYTCQIKNTKKLEINKTTYYLINN